MKKQILLLIALVGMVVTLDTFCCPFAFSPEDQRPFFEQYSLEKETVDQTEKESS